MHFDRNIAKDKRRVGDPDPDSWSPVNCYEWTAGSGRVNTTGLFVGARKFCKYKLPCKWTMLPVADSAEIQSLIEDGPDFAELEFWHNGKYYSISANASDYVPQGLVRLDGGEYYKSCTVTFAER